MPLTLLCTMLACPPRLARAAGLGAVTLAEEPWQEGWSLRVRGAPDQAPGKQDTPASHGFFTGLVPKGRGSEDGEQLREYGRREGLPGWDRGAPLRSGWVLESRARFSPQAASLVWVLQDRTGEAALA